eukprot:Hpha_TRINITY_DN26420_c0_g1::TRINITY_DN26420_c0_g1_i1::g.34016::m.34016
MSDMAAHSGWGATPAARSKSSVRRDRKAMETYDLLDPETAGSGDLIDTVGREVVPLSLAAVSTPDETYETPSPGTGNSSAASSATRRMRDTQLARSAGKFAGAEARLSRGRTDAPGTDIAGTPSAGRGARPSISGSASRVSSSQDLRRSSAATRSSTVQEGGSTELRSRDECDRLRQQLQEQLAGNSGRDAEREGMLSAMQAQAREMKRLEAELEDVRLQLMEKQAALAAAEEARVVAESKHRATLGELQRARDAAAVQDARERHSTALIGELRVRLSASLAAQRRFSERAETEALAAQVAEAELASLKREVDEADSPVELLKELEVTQEQLAKETREKDALWEENERLVMAEEQRRSQRTPQSATHHSNLPTTPLGDHPQTQEGAMTTGSSVVSGASPRGSLLPRAHSNVVQESPVTPFEGSASFTSPNEVVAPPRSTALQGQRTHFGFVPSSDVSRRSSLPPENTNGPKVPDLCFPSGATSFCSPSFPGPGRNDVNARRPLTARHSRGMASSAPELGGADDAGATARTALMRRQRLQAARDARKQQTQGAGTGEGRALELESLRQENLKADALRRSASSATYQSPTTPHS